ncbi:MAG: DNA gyrase inhibitor YacG [Planctomycetes bacterium]|nr:DNA gyrase inhibitor YacG [Planctomycetota bacterium]
MHYLCARCRDPRRVLSPDSQYFPFCSRECRERDLSSWIREEYRVPARSADAGDAAATEEAAAEVAEDAPPDDSRRGGEGTLRKPPERN